MATSETFEDVFLLYNEREDSVGKVAEALRERGISVYYFQRDFPYGSEISSGETSRLEAARVVIVLLGQQGWGPTQREIARNAQSLRKLIVPVLFDDPPDDALEDVGGLFTHTRYFDARKLDGDTFNRLADAVMKASALQTPAPAENALRFDDLFRTLKDGDDVQRLALLQWIIRHGVTNSEAFASKLRDNILGDFSPGQERQFATAVRDPKRLASSRSWMLSVLIWLKPFSAESGEVVLRHLDPQYETDRSVRFWVLAGTIQAGLPVRREAYRQTLDDEAEEVAGLAAIASRPTDESVWRRLQSSMDADDFETAWYVLRILRVVPVEALARDVVSQLDRSATGKALTYDALFALGSPEMARAAHPDILERIGLNRFAALVLGEARNSTAIATLIFARVLSVFERDDTEAALLAAADGPDDRRLVRAILDEMDRLRSSEEEDGMRQVPGHSSDKIDIAKDDIGIQRDVRMLASVMLAKDVEPPLAIGLFGEWGSGKSFYIKSLEAGVNDLALEAGKRSNVQFCSRIVQIHFNAWHYIDTSLWASLVSHLLDSLSAYLSPKPTPAEQRADLVRELAGARSEINLAREEQASAAEQLEKSTKELQDKVIKRERQEIRLRDLRAADLVNLFKENAALKSSMKTALEQVGAPAAFESIGELNKVVEESYKTAGRANALLISLVTARNVAIALVGVALLVAVPPLVDYGVKTYVADAAADLAAWFAKLTVGVGTVTVVLRSAFAKAHSAFDTLSTAKRSVDEKLAAKRAEPSDEEKLLQAEISGARASEQTAKERVAAATARAMDIESRVAALEEAQSLGYFVAERSKSEDYRRHLGLISTIRKDFEGLVNRLREARAKENGIDRIVLYIDDVDRCPPSIVVDILQAVHLLLAYELFVVVVSVDPRWLRRSLETHLAQFNTAEEKPGQTMSGSPQDYLEKIFQIPFSVRPMNRAGFGRMMRRLLPSSMATSTAQSAAESMPTDRQGEAVATVDQGVTTTAPGIGAGAWDGALTSSEAGGRPLSGGKEKILGPAEAPEADIPNLDDLAEILPISQAEAEFSQRLNMLLRTPRSAKRFANLYRLLKASVSRGELSAFQGEPTVPGDFQLPMLLLAMLVGRTSLAKELFSRFLAEARSGNRGWWTAGWDSMATMSPEQSFLRVQLDELVGGSYFPTSPELVFTWLPRVARYSFTTGGMFLEEQYRPAAQQPTSLTAPGPAPE